MRYPTKKELKENFMFRADEKLAETADELEIALYVDVTLKNGKELKKVTDWYYTWEKGVMSYTFNGIDYNENELSVVDTVHPQATPKLQREIVSAAYSLFNDE